MIGQFTSDELLKYAIEQGIVDLHSIEVNIEMNKRKEYLEMHTYDVWRGKNGLWYTYLPDGKGGRVQRKRSTEEEINNVIVEYYKGNEEKFTFKKSFFSMIAERKEIVSSNTYERYFEDYDRFFKDTEICDKEITLFNAENINNFIIKRTKELNLRKKAMKAMYSYLKMTFFHVRVNHWIKENPFDLMKKSSYYFQFCYVPLINVATRTVSKTQSERLQEQFKKDHISKPYYIPTYAVELAMLTGLRVGEIAALSWDESIVDNALIIDKEEIYDRKEKKYYIADYTKNRKPRIVPITEQIQNLLDRIAEIEKTIGCYGKYIFMNENGKINKRTISDCARNKSLQAGIEVKSIHAHRRTLNSAMRCVGASSTVASSILGNTEEVNENYYTYDITEIQEKKKLLESAQRLVITR